MKLKLMENEIEKENGMSKRFTLSKFLAFGGAMLLLGSSSMASANSMLNLGAPIPPNIFYKVTTYLGHGNGADITYGTSSQQRSIVASHWGVVEFAGWKNGYGNIVIIRDHNGWLSTYYAHLASMTVKSGDKVQMGQKIGIMGTTGNSTGVHLHFEVRINGVAIDPTTIQLDDQPVRYNVQMRSLYNNFPEGTNARSLNDATVWRKCRGAKFYFKTMTEVTWFGGADSIRITRADAINQSPIAKPSPGTMYKQRDNATVYIQDPWVPLIYVNGSWQWGRRSGRFAIASAWWVEQNGGWGQIQVVPSQSFNLNDFVDILR